MRKQFNLNYYLEHPDVKVVTRDGKDARIICADLKNKTFPIAAAFIESGLNCEDVETYTPEGRCVSNPEREYRRDLFFDLPDPIKKKVPLTNEDLMERVRAGKTMWISCDTDIYAKLIIGFNSNFTSTVVGIGTNPEISKFNHTELMNYNFVDGDPCWKEVINERAF